MKLSQILQKTARVALAVLWRVALTAALLAFVATVGAAMVLNMVLCGPSETARNELTLTLLAHEETAAIPGYFLSESAINAICAVPRTLSGSASDPALIAPGSSQDADGYLFRTFYVDENNPGAGEITLIYDKHTDLSGIGITTGNGENYAGFNADGVLVIAASEAEAQALGVSSRCGAILLLNGQVNEGLFGSPSGYAPRTAIGQRADGTAILVTLENGTWQDLMNIMVEYNAVNACCIGSSTFSSEE